MELYLEENLKRIRLASQIGSGQLSYVYLDEVIGLHQKDNIKLLHAFRLRDLGKQ